MTDKEIKIERYREENKTAQKGQIVFTGSSLMEMFPINKLLREHGDDTIIYNRGIGGFISDELLAVINVCAIDLMPSKVFINIGTNDLSRSSIPISQLIDNYDRIITAIESAVPGVRIYLMAYYPVNFEAASEEMKECLKIRTNEKITAANAEVKKLAERHGQRYIDINRNLKDEQGRLRAEFTIEGLHINEAGYRAIYDDIMQFVKENTDAAGL
ncbi:MAG: GDSL-type esterase/lipase family protein [Oscillospiraceae bacterium]